MLVRGLDLKYSVERLLRAAPLSNVNAVIVLILFANRLRYCNVDGKMTLSMDVMLLKSNDKWVRLVSVKTAGGIAVSRSTL